MRKTKVLVTCIAALAATLGMVAQASAQTGGSTVTGKEITIEELFLRNVEMQIMREKAFSEDQDTKLSALDDIEKMITQKQVGDNQAQLEFVLEYLSMEGSLRTVRQDRHQINDFPDVRRKAVNLLGQLGGDQSVQALITVLLGDQEPTVKAEAAYALGSIGTNAGNSSTQALAYAVGRQDPAKPDNNFAYAVCLAIEKIGQKTGIFNDPGAVQTLVSIAQGAYIKTVKLKALAVLDEMKKQGR
jgi:hypothetical protein